MQFMKFELLNKSLVEQPDCEGVACVDFDAFFLRDISRVFSYDYNLGISTRSDLLPKIKQLTRKNKLRALTNGGVIFSKNQKGSVEINEFALKIMRTGQDRRLPEYDQIFRELEHGPKKHQWDRSNLRWWVDQVFLSSLVLASKQRSMKSRLFFDFDKFKIGLFACDQYNHLNPVASDLHKLKSQGMYIAHMKDIGREALESFNSAVSGII